MDAHDVATTDAQVCAIDESAQRAGYQRDETGDFLYTADASRWIGQNLMTILLSLSALGLPSTFSRDTCQSLSKP